MMSSLSFGFAQQYTVMWLSLRAFQVGKVLDQILAGKGVHVEMRARPEREFNNDSLSFLTSSQSSVLAAQTKDANFSFNNQKQVFCERI